MKVWNSLFSKAREIERFEPIQFQVIQRKEFLEKILENSTKLSKYFNNFQNEITDLKTKLDKASIKDEEKIIFEIMKLIYEHIQKNVESTKKFIEDVNKGIVTYKGKLISEMNRYNEFKIANGTMLKDIAALKEKTDTYLKKSKDAEGAILNRLTNQPENHNQQKEKDAYKSICSAAQSNFKSAETLCLKANDSIKNFNQVQTNFLKNLPELSDSSGIFHNDLFQKFRDKLSQEEKVIKSYEDRFAEKTFTELKSQEDIIKQITEDIDGLTRFEREITLKHYVPNADLIESQNDRQFNIRATCLQIMNNNIEPNIFPNLNIENEKLPYI
jgi:hypothetical protein